jgi:hypothetical protein
VESSYSSLAERRGAPGLVAHAEDADRVAGEVVAGDALQSAIRAVVVAALVWAERDYGDAGELEADAGLAEAVRDLRRLASERGLSLGE